MIREDLLEFKYYLNRLSEFMRESYGISGQVKTFFELLKQTNSYLDAFFKGLDIFGGSDENQAGKLLDNLGAIFGCQRRFTIAIENPSNPLQVSSYAQVNLTDAELLTYIKAQIAKQNFDGTRESLQKIYSTYRDGELKEGLLKELIFVYSTDSFEAAPACTIRWNKQNPSANMRLLFENGYLTIESVGILYRRSIVNFTNLAYFVRQEFDLVTSPTQPSDWSDQGKYFTISVVGPASSTWDDSKKYGKVLASGEGSNPASYLVLSQQPTDWGSVYSDYKELSLTEKGSSSYAPSTYYKTSVTDANRFAEVYYSILSGQAPKDWAKGGYYSVGSAASSQWDASKEYAKASSLGYDAIPNQPTTWATLHSSCVEMNKTDGSEAYVANTYYQKKSKGGFFA